ncbi:MAG: hypothetical protein ACRDMV_03845 [Streptosporangiales bacterium]
MEYEELTESMPDHDRLEVLYLRRKVARFDYEDVTGQLWQAVDRAAEGGMNIDDIATHAGLTVAAVKERLGQ